MNIRKLCPLSDSILQRSHRLARTWQVFPGVNLSDRDEGWKQNFREPDVAVFLRGGKAINRGTHWQGAADFLVEIISPGERTREKIPFYSSIGVVELLIVDRDPWSLELYRQQDGQLTKVGQSTLAAPDVLASQTVGPDVPTSPRRTAAADSSDAPSHRAAVGVLKPRRWNCLRPNQSRYDSVVVGRLNRLATRANAIVTGTISRANSRKYQSGVRLMPKNVSL